MRKQKQLFRHRPDEGVFGDCQRTVFACLLDLSPEEVPHEHRTMSNGEQQDIFRAWLQGRGWTTVSFAFQCEPAEVLTLMKAMNPGVYYMLSGESRTGCNHVVIALDDEIVWDPSLDDSGIIGRCDDGFTWVEFLVPASMTRTS